MTIKVCGLREPENIRAVESLGVDWIGMVFWGKSSRNVTMIPVHAGIIPDRAPTGAAAPLSSSRGAGRKAGKSPKRVGVFVDEMAQNIITRVFNFGLDIVQLHGKETPTLIRNLRRTLDPDIRPGIQFIKAISVGCRDDIAAYKDYADCVDYFLFDTRVPRAQYGDAAAAPLPGGSGRQFDWSVLDAYDGDVPFLLSGGIGPDDAARVRAFHHPKCIGIDLNSRFESEPGVKDIEKLKAFIQQL